MDFSFTDQQKALRDNIVKFAQRELCEGAMERDRSQTFSPELWRRCADIGIQGLPVPEEYGGSGFDPLSCAIGLEALGYGCRDGGLVFSLCAHLLACAVPLWSHGSPEQKRRYLPALCDGSLIGMHALTEPGSGSDSFSMRTRAEKESDGWRINGTKTFISNAPVGDLALVFALTDAQKGFYGGVTAFIVPARNARILGRQQIRKNGPSHVSGRRRGVPGHAGSRRRRSRRGRRRIVGIRDRHGLGANPARGQPCRRHRASDGNVAHLRQNAFPVRTGNRKIPGCRSQDRRHENSTRGRALLTYRSAWRLENSRSASLDASITKLFVSETLVKVALDTVQIHGGYGFIAEFEVERALRDAVGSTIYSGTSEMQRNIIARWLGL